MSWWFDKYQPSWNHKIVVGSGIMKKKINYYFKLFNQPTRSSYSSYNRILGTIIANKYRDGIFFKLITLNERYELQVEDRTINTVRLGTFQSINEGFSNFIWRGHEYSSISYFLDAVRANTDAMNY